MDHGYKSSRTTKARVVGPRQHRSVGPTIVVMPGYWNQEGYTAFRYNHKAKEQNLQRYNKIVKFYKIHSFIPNNSWILIHYSYGWIFWMTTYLYYKIDRPDYWSIPFGVRSSNIMPQIVDPTFLKFKYKVYSVAFISLTVRRGKER